MNRIEDTGDFEHDDSDDKLEITEPLEEDLVHVTQENVNSKGDLFKIQDKRKHETKHYVVAEKQSRFCVTQRDVKNIILGRDIIRRESRVDKHPYMILKDSSKRFNRVLSGKKITGECLILTRVHLLANNEGEIYGYKFKDTSDKIPVNFPVSLQRNGVKIRLSPNDIVQLIKGDSIRKVSHRINLESTQVKKNNNGNLYAVAKLRIIDLKQNQETALIPKVRRASPPAVPYQSQPSKLRLGGLLRVLRTVAGANSAVNLINKNKSPKPKL